MAPSQGEVEVGHASCLSDLRDLNGNFSCPVGDVRKATDYSFVLICAFLIFFMKGGFVMLEYGACSIGPVGRRLLLRMKVIDTVLGALAFWLVGYSIAFSHNDSPFEFNYAQFEDLEANEHHLEEAKSEELWEFHFAFAANAATVVTGAVVGRVQLLGYVLGTIALTGFVHPVAARWVWNEDGFLTSVNLNHDDPGIWDTNGFIDFAGAVVIHLLGAVAALVCVVFAGRSKRPVSKPDEYIATLGVMILWFSWYGFCCGTADGMTDFRYVAVAHIALVVTLTIASAGLTMALMQAIKQVRKGRNVPRWEKGEGEMKKVEQVFPRREMIAQIRVLKSCVKRAVQTYKQSGIMVDYLTLSDNDKETEWASDLQNLRGELRKVWHTGNPEVIEKKVEDLTNRMEEGISPAPNSDRTLPPDVKKLQFQGHGRLRLRSSIFRSQYFRPRSQHGSQKTSQSSADQSQNKPEAPYAEWTDHDDQLVILLCGMRNRHPLGDHLNDYGDHHELHPSLYELAILVVIFIGSLPALLPILIFLLSMAYLGPVNHKHESEEKLRLEHEHETTPDAEPHLVNSDLVDWYLVQREKKKQNLLTDHEEIELESLGFQWYPQLEDINLLEILHAMLVGLVAITACGNVLPSYMAVVIGVVCVFFYELGVVIEQIFQLQDSLHAFPVHGMGGLCGAIFASFSFIHNRDGRFKLFYDHEYLGEPYRQWLVQYLGLIVIIVWVILSMLFVYGILWFFDLLAMERDRLNKWRIGMRQQTAWSSLKHLFYHAASAGLCGVRVIRHDRDDTDGVPKWSRSRSRSKSPKKTKSPTPPVFTPEEGETSDSVV